MEVPLNPHLQGITTDSHQLAAEMLFITPKNQQQQQQQQVEKKPRPNPSEEPLKCPRCSSTNTKFCYYNNYSLSQPRYFCKGCRRYWTQGGTLRNVPVGGGCRKNKRSISTPNPNSIANTTTNTNTSTNPTSMKTCEQNFISTSNIINNVPFPLLPYDASNLTLAFAGLHHKQSHNNIEDFVLGHANIGLVDMLGNNGLIDASGFNNLYYEQGNDHELDHIEGEKKMEDYWSSKNWHGIINS